MVEPEPIERAFRQNLLRRGERRLIEIRMADQRVENDGAAVAQILAQPGGFRRVRA